MGEILKKLQNEMKEALKNKNKEKLSTIRMLISEIKKVQIDTKKELNDDEVLSIIQRYAKQRREAIEQYNKAGRDDLVEKEKKELNIVLEFLPKQLTEKEIEEIVDSTIKELNATSMKDMGKVMKTVMEKVKGRAEGSIISRIVKSRLSI